MRIPRPSLLLLGALLVSATLSVGLLVPSAAQADAPDMLAAVPVSGAMCNKGAPTVDDVVTAAASAIRTAVPAAQLGAYDQQVNQFRATVAAARVHRDLLPVDPTTVDTRTSILDDPIVTYLVNGLDAVRTGRIDQTMSVSQLTVNDVIEMFILGNRIVEIPAEFAASLVPTAGFFLKFLVGGVFSGVQALARLVQGQMDQTCLQPNAYHKLVVDTSDITIAPVAVPQPITDLANQLTLANGKCTPVSDLTTSTVVERARTYLDRAGLPLNPAQVDATAAGLQNFLRSNRVATVALMRKENELGPAVQALDYGPITFLTNLGFDIYEGKALDTVALSDVSVENVYDLVSLSLDVSSLLLAAANLAAGWTGVSDAILTPLSIAQSVAFAPTDYGLPIIRGVMQSMCAV